LNLGRGSWNAGILLAFLGQTHATRRLEAGAPVKTYVKQKTPVEKSTGVFG